MIERTGDTCRPTACSLSPAGLRARKAVIDGLLARGLERLTAITGGVLAEFLGGAQIAAEVETLVSLEAECCPFDNKRLGS